MSGDTQDPAPDFPWEQIEQRCEWSLGPKVRSEIVRAAEEFLSIKTLGRSAPLLDVKLILEAYDKAASRFFHALFTDPSGDSDASLYAHHLIERNCKGPAASSTAPVFDQLLALIRAFHIACNVSIKQLNEQPASAFNSGNAWQLWCGG